MSDYKVRARTGTLGNQIAYGLDFSILNTGYESGGNGSRWAALNKKTYKKAKFSEFFSGAVKELHQFNLLAHFVRRTLPKLLMDEVVRYRASKTQKEILVGDKRYLADGQKIKVLRVDEKDTEDQE